MTEELIEYKAEPLEMNVMILGKILSASGYFQDAREAAQAVVKVLAGRELGFGPIASMSGIFIVNGKPVLSANMQAASIRKSGKYDYKIVRLDNDVCELAFFRDGQELQPHSIFTMADATTAGLTEGKNAHSWKHYKRNMLFSRCITNGMRWHSPELGCGAIYTPEELDMVIDGDTGEIVSQYAPDTPKATKTNGKPQPNSKMWKGEQPPAEPPEAPPPAKVAVDKDVPNTALKLLEYVNQRVLVPYDHEKHLRNAIREELKDPGWDWLSPTNLEGWQVALNAALKHAKAKVPADDLAPETVNLSEEMEKALDAPGED